MKVNKIHYVDNYSEYLEALGVGWMRNGHKVARVMTGREPGVGKTTSAVC